MKTFILLTFAVMAFVFYEKSGGADYVPETREMADARHGLEVANATVARAEINIAVEPVIAPARAPVAPRQLDYMPASFDADAPLLTDAQLAQLNIITEADPITPPRAIATRDLFQVAGSRVNMREGPGTTFGVIITLNSGTQAEIIERDQRLGWAKVRVVGSGAEGWMAERLLEPANS